MAHQPVKLNENRVRVDAVASRLIVPGIAVGVLGLGVAVALAFTHGQETITHFFYSYLLSFVFFLALTLGSLFFVMLHHATRAGWSVAIRRIAEGLASNVVLMIVLFLPLLFGLHYLFTWANPATHFAEHKPWDTYKNTYLTTSWFVIRFVVYFVVWTFLALYLKRQSIRQDTSGDVQLSVKMGRISLPGMILLGATLTGAAIDLLMSLSANWYSTIFGVYIFAGCVLTFLASITLIALWLRGKGILAEAISVEHYHDLGKLMFAFTFFWGYIAFSQYMLIWYSNMPDETAWFLPRQIGPWMWVSIILLFGHLFIPFAALLTRHTKRRLNILAFWAVWILAAEFLDLFYIIMPNEWVNKLPPGVQVRDLVSRYHVYSVNGQYGDLINTMNFPLSPMALLITISCFLGMGGIYVAFAMMMLRGNSIVPLKDPRLAESLAFENI